MHIACKTMWCAPPSREVDDVHSRRVRRLEGENELEFLAGCLGMFFPKSIEVIGSMGEMRGDKYIPVVMNERRVYERNAKFGPRHPAYGHLELWWAGDYWWLGPATACGQPMGLLRLRTQGPSPEGVDWSYYCSAKEKWRVAGVKSGKVYEESEKATEITAVKPKAEGSAGGAASAVDGEGESEGEETEREMTEEEAQNWWREEMCAVKELLGAHSLDKCPRLQVNSAYFARES